MKPEIELEQGKRSLIQMKPYRLITATPDFLRAVITGDELAANRLLGNIRTAGWPTNPETRRGLPMHLYRIKSCPHELQWHVRLIVLEDEQRVIGSISIKGKPTEPDSSVDMGWELEPAFRGEGYAAAAAKEVRDWLFQQPEVRHITAVILKSNHKSIAVAKHLNMENTSGIFWQVECPTGDHAQKRKRRRLSP